MVGQRHGDGLNVLIVEDLAHVLVALGLLTRLALDLGLAALESGLVDIADSDDASTGKLPVFRHVSLATAAQPNHRDIDLVISSTKPCGGGGCNRRGCEGEKSSSG